MKKQKIKIGDTLYLEQAWVDDNGNEHDEFADVVDIDFGGFMKLKFVHPAIDNFLAGADFHVDDYQDSIQN